MTHDHRLALPFALTVCCALVACDTEPVEDLDSVEAAEVPVVEAPAELATNEADADAGSAQFEAFGHVAVATVLATPWVEVAMKQHERQAPAEFEACARVFHGAEAITFGAHGESFEVYITGQLELDDASACGDMIDGSDEPVSAVVLDEDLFAVYRGELEPSRERLQALSSHEPKAGAGQPIWLTASALSMSGHHTPADAIELWVDLAQGVDAHAQVEFRDEGSATEIFGQATLGLSALRMSDDVAGLASAVSLAQSGKAMTVDIHASAEQMQTVAIEMASEAHADHGKHHGRSGGEVHFELRTSN